MRKSNLYVDVHVLQTVPPSCVNRDDTGSPKTAPYGGVTRARVSSQAWKRAMRKLFPEIFEAHQVGIRTKHVPTELAKKITALNADLEASAQKLAVDALNNAGIGTKQEKKDPEATTKALFFASQLQLEELAKLEVAGEKDKKKYQEALKAAPAMDIALFGRMVADDPSLNFDAAAQVAHAISTHAVHNEYDYFTAVDDCSPADNAGAGHLGTVEFNSSTLYRYATVNVLELKRNLDKAQTIAAVKGFVEAFLCSMPDGKQNTFANRTMPDMVYLTIRKDTPVNLCGAFEKPIPASAEGFVQRSEQALLSYARKRYATFVDAPVSAYAVGDAAGLEELATVLPLGRMLDALEGKVTELLNEVAE